MRSEGSCIMIIIISEAAFQSVHSIEYVIITDWDEMPVWFDLLATWQRKLASARVSVIQMNFVCSCVYEYEVGS